MVSLVAVIETFLDERREDFVFLATAIEERTYMPRTLQYFAAKMHRLLFHDHCAVAAAGRTFERRFLFDCHSSSSLCIAVPEIELIAVRNEGAIRSFDPDVVLLDDLGKARPLFLQIGREDFRAAVID
ncbi:MAG: hypothetical protein ACXWC3_04805, partial [Burkholderiales bacterium]